MVAILLLFGLGILLIIGVVWFVKQLIFMHDILHKFKKCNVVVDGKKGNGKDLLFQWVINKRKDFYYANIDYSNPKLGKRKLKKLRKIITPGAISVAPNTYDNFIKNDIKKVKRTFKEGKDIYLSDGGIILPSYMDSKLYKEYPSLPIFYALSRHLYNSNIHVNVQNFNRLWKALREQADYFIHVKKSFKIFGIMFTKCTTYDKYESAVSYLEPVKTRLINKYSKAETDIYNATNGEIHTGWVIQRVHKLYYDTRAFEKILLDGKRIK